MNETQPRVIVSVDAGVAEVRLNRADKRNGLDLAMFEALVAAGQQVAADRRVRAVVLSGEEAARLGLVTHLAADPLELARQLARTIAAQSPHAIRAAKALCNATPEQDTAAAFAHETALQMPLLGSANQLEAVRAVLSRRAPEFQDPE